MSIENKHLEIVIARYNEGLEWTLEEPFSRFQYTVYNKGKNDNFQKENVTTIHTLPNVGKDVHTYLHHIVHNYDTLADITMFIPATMHVTYKKHKAITLLTYSMATNFEKAIFLGQYSTSVRNTFASFDQSIWIPTTKENQDETQGDSSLYLSQLRPFGTWFDHYFGNKKVDWWSYNNTFSIDKRDIHRNPKEYYETFLNMVSMANDTEAAHYIERSWYAILGPFTHTTILPHPMYYSPHLN